LKFELEKDEAVQIIPIEYPPREECPIDVIREMMPLAEVMTQLAERIQVRSEEELERKVNRIEPALVLVGSGLVGMILLSVLLPLTRIMAAIG
jgi:hypothetical protein